MIDRKAPGRGGEVKPPSRAGWVEGEKIVRRKLSDPVLERLQELILSGELGAGDPMPAEHDPMGRFGVGRSAVRTAIVDMIEAADGAPAATAMEEHLDRSNKLYRHHR